MTVKNVLIAVLLNIAMTILLQQQNSFATFVLYTYIYMSRYHERHFELDQWRDVEYSRR